MTQESKCSVLIFGASGAIGSELVRTFEERDWQAIGVSRQIRNINGSATKWVNWTSGEGPGGLVSLEKYSLDAVVWAQGLNVSDDIRSLDADKHAELYRANVWTIIESLQILLERDSLVPSARLCIISSIWQNIVRERKLSYCVTKSALQGLVQSLAIDLGPEGKLVNAVLPGALDTPMTQANLTSQQLTILKGMTPSRSLPELSDVCNTVEFLCSQKNTGLTGQFIIADRGFSIAKYI